jgi:hypothetical protein
MHVMGIARVVAGGQTGVDRAALDAAVALGIPYGGWCPAGGWAEDHPEPPGLLARYPGLRETPDRDPATRTAWNVRDSDATLVVLPDAAWHSPGTDLTLARCRGLGRPHLVATATDRDLVRDWLAALPDDLVLDVAGPRESEAPGIHVAARTLLLDVLPLLSGDDAQS